MRPDQERVRTLLAETVALLCKNGLHYGAELQIQGLLGITIDKNEVFIVHIDECITGANIKQQATVVNSSVPMSGEEPSTFQDPSRFCQPDLSIARHKKPRKQNSPRRETSSEIRLDAFEDQDRISAVDPWMRCGVENQVKVEHLDDASHTETNRASSVAVKQEENTQFESSDVLIIDSNDVSCERSIERQHLNMRAKKMAVNRWSPKVPNYGGYGTKFNQRHRFRNSTHLSTGNMSSRLDYCSVGEPITNSDQTAGCTSWQVSDQLANSAVTSSPNCISQVSAAVGSSHHPRQQLASAWSDGGAFHGVRLKRYECTVDGCGRQYLNTFDLYRHQRQKHLIPSNFYQRGKKTTFGIRELSGPDPAC